MSRVGEDATKKGQLLEALATKYPTTSSTAFARHSSILRERSIPETTVTISSLLDTQECLIVLRSRTHDTMFREDDNNLLKEFRCAFVELTTNTFTHMHILFSSATSRAIFSHNTQLSRWPNFGLNSRKTLRRDGKLIERTVNTFPSAAAAFRVCRKACNRREESFTR